MLGFVGSAGGGSFVADAPNDDLNINASVERHVGDSDGYVVAEMEEGTYYYTYSGKEESFEVPEAGDYELIAVGGMGGSCNNNRGGYGAKASGRFRLSEGDRLNIVVGGKGGDCNSEVIGPSSSGETKTMYNGAGGAGGTYVELERATSKTPQLLLAAGGGGGAGKKFDGEDGQDGPSGGFDWGGKNGGGGGLCQDSNCSENFFLIGGAGGGGYEGNGDSRCGDPSCDAITVGPIDKAESQCEEKKKNLLAEGGESFQNGSKGGYHQVGEFPHRKGTCLYWYRNGKRGGFGGGGEGGIFFYGQYTTFNKDNQPIVVNSEENGGGGGGGGFSGGGAAEFGGNGGGG